MEVRKKEELDTGNYTISVGIKLTWGESDPSFVTGPVADLAKEIPYELLNSIQVRLLFSNVSFEFNRDALEPYGAPWRWCVLERRIA